jgi:hypothetical protein
MQDDHIPYTTKTGIKIGSRYELPMRVDYTHEEKFIQNLLIGTPEFSLEEKIKFVGYVACVFLIVFLLSALGVR